VRCVLGLVLAGAVLLGTGVAVAGRPDSAPSGITVMLDVDFAPDVASAPRRPRGVRLDYHFLAGNPQTGERLPAIRDTRLRFQRGFRFNGPLFRRCSPSAAEPADCPSRSRVGRGDVVVDARPAAAAPMRLGLLVYNTRPRRGNTRFLFFAQANGTVVSKLFAEVVTDPTGPYREALVLDLGPPDQQAFAIREINLRTLNRRVRTRVNGRSVRRYLLEAPRRCRGSWRTADAVDYANGESLVAADTSPCDRP
jgi:hypothetical protein